MRLHLEQGMESLKLTVLEMISQTREAVAKAILSLQRMDADLAQEVIDGDQGINALEVKVDALCLKLLALEGPVARDLRYIIGIMRICVDLERIGDEAANIAGSTIFLSLKPPLPFYSQLYFMGQKAAHMLEQATHSFIELNSALAKQVCKMDFEVDDLNSKAIKEIINYMGRQIPAIERSVQSISIARRLERIADLATNIAESTVFIDQGINIKHYCQFDNRI